MSYTMKRIGCIDFFWKWNDVVFPLIIYSIGKKCLIGDSCKALAEILVKEHKDFCGILNVLIPDDLKPQVRGGLFVELCSLRKSAFQEHRNSLD